MKPTDEQPPLNNVDDARGHHVYVVTLLDDGRVKEQAVYASLFEADEEHRRLCLDYGASRGCLASREVE